MGETTTFAKLRPPALQERLRRAQACLRFVCGSKLPRAAKSPNCKARPEAPDLASKLRQDLQKVHAAGSAASPARSSSQNNAKKTEVLRIGRIQVRQSLCSIAAGPCWSVD